MLGDKTKGGFYKKQRRRTGEAAPRRSTGRRWSIVRAKSEVPVAGNGEEQSSDTAASACECCIGFDGDKLDKAGQFLWTASDRSLDLLGESHSRDLRHRRRDRSRDEAGLQLGDGTVRTVGRGRRAATVERMKKEGPPFRRKSRSCSPPARHPGTRTLRHAASGRAYFDLATGLSSR